MAEADTASQWAASSHAAGARRSRRRVPEPEASRAGARWSEGPRRGGAAAESAARRPLSERPRPAAPPAPGRARGRARSRRPPSLAGARSRRRRLPARAAAGRRAGAAWPRPRAAAEPAEPRSRSRIYVARSGTRLCRINL
ncbi:Hmg Domain-Containing Protein 3 [Manis pentadactyla]|nr:Hmg Domain-Containing Protein 3 [Manis pentadactyla]